MAASQDQKPAIAHLRATQSDWARLYEHAADALQRRLLQTPELSPRAVAEGVAAALPRSIGKWLLRRLAALGWLASDAVIRFDILDGPDCPPQFLGGQRELVRLAVFGPAGQGMASRDKRRMDVYQQLCAEIMRIAVDSVSLDGIAHRAMNHPDVHTDPLLGSMLRSFIAEREVALRAIRPTPAEEQRKKEETSKLTTGFNVPIHTSFPTREELSESFTRMQREFDGYLAQFEDVPAQRVLGKMRELRHRFPIHIPSATLQRCEEQYDRLLKRAGTYRRQIKELAVQGAAAAREGNAEVAGWVVRRLEAIHTLLPTLLPSDRLAELRTEILHSEQEHETAEAARELLERKREVAAKIKNLAGVVHRFHELAARLPPEDEAYRRAEENYRRAVEEIRGLNTEWLTGLVLQLETLLDDLDDPAGQIQNKLDQFIGNVRTALNRLCLEIRSHRQKNTRPPDPGPRPPNGNPPTGSR